MSHSVEQSFLQKGEKLGDRTQKWACEMEKVEISMSMWGLERTDKWWGFPSEDDKWQRDVFIPKTNQSSSQFGVRLFPCCCSGNMGDIEVASAVHKPSQYTLAIAQASKQNVEDELP